VIDDALLLLTESLVETGAGPRDKCRLGLGCLGHEGTVVTGR
jgi:hypothetical protein